MNIWKKLLRAKRAFSPVIAALILMLLAVAAGVVVYSYTMGWIGGATRTPGGIQGELTFDSIYGDATNNLIKIYVRNSGGKDLTLDEIYVDGVNKANATTFTTSSLTVNSIAYLEVSVTMTANYFYEVTVSCTDGTKVIQSVEAE